MLIHNASATRAPKTLHKVQYNASSVYALAMSTRNAGQRLVLASRLGILQPIDVCSVFPMGAAGITIDSSLGASAKPQQVKVRCESPGPILSQPWLLGPYGVAVLWPSQATEPSAQLNISADFNYTP